jgi:hypothetical protein
VRPVAAILCLSSSACAYACGSGGGASSADAGDHADAGSAEASVELGTGETEFEPVTPNEHLTLHAGTQGGHHVWLSYRTDGLLPDNIQMELDVVPEAPARPAHSHVTIDLDPVSGDDTTSASYEFIGWPAQVLDPECAAGGSVSIMLKLTDTLGHTASGSMMVIADPPEAGFTRSCTL